MASAAVSINADAKMDPPSMSKQKSNQPLLADAGSESDSSINSNSSAYKVAVYESPATKDSMAFQVFAAVCFMLSAMSLLLLNKAIMHFYPYTFTVIFLQDFITVVMAAASIWWQAWHNGTMPATMGFQDFVRFLPAMCFFLVTLVTGLEVFKYISVITFIALRYTTCWLSYFGDVYLLGRQHQPIYLISLGLIGLGAGVYASADLEYSKIGYIWLIMNILCHSGFALYVKWIDSKNNYNVFVMSLFNNLQTLVPLLLCAFIWKELPSRSLHALSNLTKVQHLILWSSCVAGYCISVTGFYAQKLFSATAWTIQSNLNKIPTMLLSYWLFKSKISVGALVGAVILLAGGFAYSLTALHMNKKEKEEKAAQAAKDKAAEESAPAVGSNGYAAVPNEDPEPIAEPAVIAAEIPADAEEAAPGDEQRKDQ